MGSQKAVIALDTNVLVRWIARDDPGQAERADVILQEPFLISSSVLTELGWVLRTCMNMDRTEIGFAVSKLINLPTANLPFAANVRWAVERYALQGDWADLIHIATSTDADSFGSFEKRLAKQTGPGSPIPIVDLDP